jgi:hypothetical protein
LPGAVEHAHCQRAKKLKRIEFYRILQKPTEMPEKYTGFSCLHDELIVLRAWAQRVCVRTWPKKSQSLRPGGPAG